MSEDLIRRSDAIDAIHNYWKKRLETLPTEMSEYGEVYADTNEMDKILEHNKTLCSFIKDIPTIEPKREEWADIIGYEGLYQVSNEARVRNQKGEILKQYIKRGRSTCYKAVKLYKDGRYKTRYIHRIMAECFIPNPNNLPMINHIDEDGTNNRLDNLEWCTVKYNSNYGNAKKNMSKGKRKRLTADMRGKDDD